jgi:hypothetical protein
MAGGIVPRAVMGGLVERVSQVVRDAPAEGLEVEDAGNEIELP